MKITQEIIDLAKQNGACSEGIEWGYLVLDHKLTINNIKPGYYLWLGQFDIELDQNLLDYCAKQKPWKALEYASKRLTPETLEWCAKQEILPALKYAHNELTPETLEWCAKQEPLCALQYVNKRLSHETLDWCAKQELFFDFMNSDKKRK